MTCHDECEDKKKLCVDTDTAKKCSLCALSCAKTYDTGIRINTSIIYFEYSFANLWFFATMAALRACLGSVSRKTKSTYNSPTSSCSNEVSYIMDTCMSECESMYATWDEWIGLLSWMIRAKIFCSFTAFWVQMALFFHSLQHCIRFAGTLLDRQCSL